MSLSDIMGAMRLYMYAEIALFIFLAMFLAVLVHVLRKKNESRFDSARYMPLDDDNPQEPRDPDGCDEGARAR